MQKRVSQWRRLARHRKSIVGYMLRCLTCFSTRVFLRWTTFRAGTLLRSASSIVSSFTIDKVEGVGYHLSTKSGWNTWFPLLLPLLPPTLFLHQNPRVITDGMSAWRSNMPQTCSTIGRYAGQLDHIRDGTSTIRSRHVGPFL